MNNRGGFFGIVFFVLFVAVVLFIIAASRFSYQDGTSKDVVQGYDKGLIWYHAYLKNDHRTAYCFDDPAFIPILEKSQKENIDVTVSYSKYIGRGFLCTAESYEKVVITKVELSGGNQ